MLVLMKGVVEVVVVDGRVVKLTGVENVRRLVGLTVFECTWSWGSGAH
jgi:hypothetical protein